jgi:hypothetical protein
MPMKKTMSMLMKCPICDGPLQVVCPSCAGKKGGAKTSPAKKAAARKAWMASARVRKARAKA